MTDLKEEVSEEIRADVRRSEWLYAIENIVKSALEYEYLTVEDLQGMLDHLHEETEAAAAEEKQHAVNEQFKREVHRSNHGFKNDERN